MKKNNASLHSHDMLYIGLYDVGTCIEYFGEDYLDEY
jgi:hypothetical protein